MDKVWGIGLFQKKPNQEGGWGAVEGMEFPGVLKKNSHGISMGLGF